MCNPAVIPLVVAGVQAVGSQLGGLSQAKATQGAATQNAQSSRTKASDAMARGNIAVNIARNEGKARIGQQVAAMGASGVDVGSGSSLDILSDTSAYNEYEAQRLRSEAMREAWGYEEEAKQYDYMAEQANQQREFTKTLLFGPMSKMHSKAGLPSTYGILGKRY